MNYVIFEPSGDPNTEAYLNGKYTNTEDEPHKDALRQFLLPEIPGQSLLMTLMTRLLVGTRLLVQNNFCIDLMRKALGLKVFPLSC